MWIRRPFTDRQYTHIGGQVRGRHISIRCLNLGGQVDSRQKGSSQRNKGYTSAVDRLAENAFS